MKKKGGNVVIAVLLIISGVVLALSLLPEDQQQQPQHDAEELAINNEDSLSSDTCEVKLDKRQENTVSIELRTERVRYKFRNSDFEVKIEVDYPVEGAASALAYLYHWIDWKLGGTYTGSFSEGQLVVDHYGEEKKEEFWDFSSSEGDDRGSAPRWSYSVSLRLKYQSDKYVNYECDYSEYTGGAHEFYSKACSTICMADGSVIGPDIFSDRFALQSILEECLMEKFGCSSVEELHARLLSDIVNIPVPSGIWLTPEGVVFHYGIYEIVSFADGDTEFTVPYPEIVSIIKPKYRGLCE